ncbi:hypothetical protein FRC09_009408 [Ceratobasidium sp. 395]|nr:hypothetical protein FRC09_009408 [Ceratobasidium sp. 395]
MPQTPARSVITLSSGSSSQGMSSCESSVPSTPTDSSISRLSHVSVHSKLLSRPVTSPAYHGEIDRFPDRPKYSGHGMIDLSYVFSKPPRAYQIKQAKLKAKKSLVNTGATPFMGDANKARSATKA